MIVHFVHHWFKSTLLNSDGGDHLHCGVCRNHVWRRKRRRQLRAMHHMQTMIAVKSSEEEAGAWSLCAAQPGGHYTKASGHTRTGIQM